MMMMILVVFAVYVCCAGSLNLIRVPSKCRARCSPVGKSVRSWCDDGWSNRSFMDNTLSYFSFQSDFHVCAILSVVVYAVMSSFLIS